MLHWFIHKKSLLTNIDDSSLIEIQNQFNNIPRKVLGYKTPLELFTKYLKRVALWTWFYHGVTAIMLAANYNLIENIKLLINAGADINAKNNDGKTVLIIAANLGHSETAKLQKLPSYWLIMEQNGIKFLYLKTQDYLN